ncbi:MAG: hypothetical protein KBT03_02265 [Bacteroidales bacterium]|nr:hypothetical protein [Candidatus Scybalousia scybalohippi]
MLNYKWKTTSDYVLIDVNCTKLHGRIIEICCVKVKNDEISDTLHSFINPNFQKSKEKENWLEYEQYPTIDDLKQQIYDFVGKNTIVGWCVDYDIQRLSVEGIVFDTTVVDVFEPWHRYLHNEVPYCSLRNVYEWNYESCSKFRIYDFDKTYDKCLATKQLYDSQKHYNMVKYQRKLETMRRNGYKNV